MIWIIIFLMAVTPQLVSSNYVPEQNDRFMKDLAKHCSKLDSNELVFQIPGKCRIFKCYKEFSGFTMTTNVKSRGCKSFYYEPPCELTSNPSLYYPHCCPKVTCPDEKQ